MGYYSNFAISRMKERIDHSCLSPERQLRERLEDLRERREALKESRTACGVGRRLWADDLRYAPVGWLCTAYEVERAIAIAEEDLIEKYGAASPQQPEDAYDQITIAVYAGLTALRRTLGITSAA